MGDVMIVAKTLKDLYFDEFGEQIDEMKMHKLMYFAQRESLIVKQSPLFNEEFKGWKFGPVLLKIRSEFFKTHPFNNISGKVSRETQNILVDVIKRYGKISSWTLSSMTHEEICWKMSREGLKPDDNGETSISIEAMMLDAIRERNARGHFA